MLIILAMVTSGISPACAFISGGKSFIQICGADGNVQEVAVDASLDPFAEPAPIEKHLESMEKCSYCFSFLNQTLALPSSTDALAAPPQHYLIVSAGIAIPHGLSMSGFHARAPPSLLS